MSARMAKARRAVRPALTEPRVRRAYFECRFGQLHVRCAIPTGGGFDEATTLLCLPGSPGSGRFYQPLLPPLGRDRSVYAPDLPGCGESDPIPGPATSADLAVALGDFLDSMHLHSVDLLAHEEGVAVAIALLGQRSGQIGRVVLSPNSDAVRTEARTLRHPALVIDLRAADGGGRDPFELERQAGELRDFLGLA
jgi:pimeloyl-ACP methyl ester carboxylesterase